MAKTLVMTIRMLCKWLYISARQMIRVRVSVQVCALDHKTRANQNAKNAQPAME